MIVMYYNKRKYWYFALTLTFVLVPTCLINYFNTRLYEPHYRTALYVKRPELKKDLRKFRIFLSCCLIGVFNRFIEAIMWRMNIKRYYHNKEEFIDPPENDPNFVAYIKTIIFREQQDCSMLRLIEAFTESSSQLLLQIYVITMDDYKNYNLKGKFKGQNTVT